MKDTKDQFVAKTIGEDQHKLNESQIEDLIKKANTSIDDAVEHKSNDVLKV